MSSEPRVTVSDEILQKADDAFWAIIAASFPAVEHGDFPPDATWAFMNAQRSAVNYWLYLNHPRNAAADLSYREQEEPAFDPESETAAAIASRRRAIHMIHSSALNTLTLCGARARIT